MEIADLRNGDVRARGRPMGKGEFSLGYAELALTPKVAIDEKADNENETHAGKELKAQCQRRLNRQAEFHKRKKEAAYANEEREESP